MLLRMDDITDRLHDEFLYHAAHTGRWGGRGVQLHNMVRGTVNSDAAIEIMGVDYEFFKECYSNPMEALSSSIRGMLIPREGMEFYVGDFSSIEAMGLPWLAGQQSTLDLFKTGADVYCSEAEGIFHRKITKEDKNERQVGKTGTLALGYGGGINAYATMARAFRLDLSGLYDLINVTANENERSKARLSANTYERAHVDDPFALQHETAIAVDIIKQRWRRNNPLIVQYWYDLEKAAIEAVLTGKKQFVTSFTIPKYETFISGEGLYPDIHNVTPTEDIERPTIIFGMYKHWLMCKLPSGRCIAYYRPRIVERETPWGEMKQTLVYHNVNETTFQFNETSTYGGKLAENITQAVCRDILAEAMFRTHYQGFPVVLHVHDEIVSEVDKNKNQLDKFKALMSEVPEWATGLPIKVGDCWAGNRYRK